MALRPITASQLNIRVDNYTPLKSLKPTLLETDWPSPRSLGSVAAIQDGLPLSSDEILWELKLLSSKGSAVDLLQLSTLLKLLYSSSPSGCSGPYPSLTLHSLEEAELLSLCCLLLPLCKFSRKSQSYVPSELGTVLAVLQTLLKVALYSFIFWFQGDRFRADSGHPDTNSYTSSICRSA
jgi:hypothetical protein